MKKKVIDIILTLNEERLITAAHDISDGGLLPTICEMLFKNNLGMDLNLPDLLMQKKIAKIFCFTHGVLVKIKVEYYCRYEGSK